MRPIKQLVLSPAGVVNALAFVASAVMSVRSGAALAWIGALAATGGFFAYTVISLFWPATNRSSARLPGVVTVCLLGLGLTIFACYRTWIAEGRLDAYPLIAAVIGGAVTFFYTFLYGNYRRPKESALVIGSRLVDLPLETLDGTPTSSAEFAGNKTLIIFFRANWCTLCMAQLKEIRARADRLALLGVNVKFVSNQPVGKSRQLAKRLNLPANIALLNDRDLRAAHALSIVDVDGTPAWMIGDYPRDTVMATAIGLDEANRILYVYQPTHYRSRPDPDSLLAFFEELGPMSLQQDAQP